MLSCFLSSSKTFKSSKAFILSKAFRPSPRLQETHVGSHSLILTMVAFSMTSLTLRPLESLLNCVTDVNFSSGMTLHLCFLAINLRRLYCLSAT